MIQANELRIGNYILDNCYKKLRLIDYSQLAKVTGISSNPFSNKIYRIHSNIINETVNDLRISDVEYVEPIPLTEEWLLKLGFKKENKTLSDQTEKIYFTKSLSDYCNLEYCNKQIHIVNYEFEQQFSETYLEVKCEYVHQLQNLYFALTGKELTLN